MLVPIPEEISYEHGSMACCGLGPTFGAFQRMQVDRHDTVLITGLGPVGLGGVINARYRGARVIGVEANQWRAERALALGAEAVVDPSDEDALKQLLVRTYNGRGEDGVTRKNRILRIQAVLPRLSLDSDRRWDRRRIRR